MQLLAAFISCLSDFEVPISVLYVLEVFVFTSRKISIYHRSTSLVSHDSKSSQVQCITGEMRYKSVFILHMNRSVYLIDLNVVGTFQNVYYVLN